MIPRPRSRCLILLLVLLVVEGFYLLYTPPYKNPDELSHLQAVRFYLSEKRLPDPYRERPKIQQDKHPPYTYVTGALLLSLGEGWFRGTESSIRLPGPHEVELRPGKVSENSGIPDGALYLLRAFMALHWLLFGWALLSLLDLCFEGRPRFAWGLALATATIPQAAMSGAALTPDTPLTAFCAGAFYFMVRGALGLGKAGRAGLAAGSFLALALLAKSAAVHLLPVLALASWMRGRRKGGGEGFRFLLWALVVPLLLSSWWYLRNQILFGDPFQMRAQVETYTHSVRRSPWTLVFFEVFFEDTFRSFFGFWERESFLARPFYLLVAGWVGTAASGLLLLFRRAPRSEAPPTSLAALPHSLCAFFVLFGLTLLGNLTVHSPQGRYLFPVLPALAVAGGLGWTIALRLRRDSKLWLVLPFLWITYGLLSFDALFLDRYAPKRSHAYGSGEVLYYEDCGSPGLHPHRVQGMDVPDGSQLGRRIPWRTVDGHAEAVVYRFPIPEGWRRDLQVRVVYFNADPRLPYLAESEGRFRYPAARMRADGRLLHEEIELTSTPETYVFPIPADLLEDGSLELRIEKAKGPAVIVAELWIERAFLRFEGRGKVWNRTGRSLEALVLWKKDGLVGSAVLEVPARGSAPLDLGIPGDAELRLLPHLLSPWVSTQAESYPAGGSRWYGDRTAEGIYFLRGRGVVARLPVPPGKLLGLRPFVRRKDPGGGWVWEEMDFSGSGAGVPLELRARADTQESFDVCRWVGGWR